MKAVVLCLFLIGCGVSQLDEPGPALRTQDHELAGGTCAPGGGVCRKGHCLAGEDWSDDLFCDHDLGCCVRTAPIAAPQTCESAGGTCRKSSCRSNEHLDLDLECGTDAACCAPN